MEYDSPLPIDSLEPPAMTLPRLRITVRRLMVAVAIEAVLLTATTRPDPVIGFQFGDLAIVGWSNGESTVKSGPAPVRFHAVGPVIRVLWSDGSTSWYLTRSLRLAVNTAHLTQRKR